MIVPFDPDRFRVPEQPEKVPEALSEESASRRRVREQAAAHAFLKGPIPLPWLQAACRLDGKVLAVGLALWYRSGVTRSSEVRLTGPLLERFGIGRAAYYRGLAALAAAGLVRTTACRGKSSVVTILPGGPAAP